MCGGFALAIGLGSRDVRHNFQRQIVYSAGRIFTYTFLGLTAGWIGFWLARKAAFLVDAQGVLSILAGGLLLLQGLTALGVLRWKQLGASMLRGAPCLAIPSLRSFLMSSRWRDVFVAGMLNGFLPCGLVYGYLALASSTADFLHGGAIMGLFGAGTLPIMVLTGLGATAISASLRGQLVRISAVCIAVTGIIAIARGVACFWTPTTAGSPHCPLCGFLIW
jgi:sulfite exporter TauE/SafE